MSGKMSMPGRHPHYQREEDLSVLWELASRHKITAGFVPKKINNNRVKSRNKLVFLEKIIYYV